ncbi:MAG: hypothetical protein WC872_03255, partial [Candidatus Absconditabacterales bacterium]
YYLNFLYTIYLLSFVFISRIKVFPFKDKEKNYNWFVDVFFSFYEFVFNQTGKKIDNKILNQLKKELLNQVEVFFLLFEFYKKLNGLFKNIKDSDSDFYSWLFYDELKGEFKTIFGDFVDNNKIYTSKATFGLLETKILQFILPADVLLRYLFIDSDMFLITETVISKLFDKNILDKFMKSFHNDGSQLESFLNYITDYRLYKKKFFSGIQKYLITVLRNVDSQNNTDDLDDLMSSIGEDMQNMESFKIPERIKRESKIMEKILNFYITFVGGFRVSRGDNFFLRLFRKNLTQEILKKGSGQDDKNYSLVYYGSMLYAYGKNVFYYKYAADNVRAGKQKFYLPYKTSFKNIYSNLSILNLFDENFLAVIFQEINPKDIRIYMKNKIILQLFKSFFGKSISSVVKLDKDDLIFSVYSSVSKNLSEIKNFLKITKDNLTQEDIYHIKENIYNFDFWLSNYFFEEISGLKINLNKNYSDLAILGIFANIKETFFGFLLYLTYLRLEEKNIKKNLNINFIIKIYLKDFLQIDEYYHKGFVQIIENIYSTFFDIMQNWLGVDDNRDYLKIGLDNWIAFGEGKSLEEISKKIIGEDVIWFKGFLKNITYYNKRFLIPK